MGAGVLAASFRAKAAVLAALSFSALVSACATEDAVDFNNAGVLAGRQGDYDVAIADYDKAIVLDPGFAFAYNNRGEAYLRKGDLDAAIADFNVAIAKQRNFTEALNNRANAYLAGKDYESAIQDYSAALELFAHGHSVSHNELVKFALLTNRAKAYVAMKDYKAAIQDYNATLELYSHGSGALHDNSIKFTVLTRRARAYNAIGDHASALPDYKEISQLSPSSASEYALRSTAWHMLYDWDHEIADTREVLNRAPEGRLKAVALNNLCMALAAKNTSLDEALSDCTQSLAINLGGPAYNSRGFVYLRMRRYREAIKDYDTALRTKPDLPTALYGRGIAKLRSGDKKGGKRDIAAAAKLDSSIAAQFENYGISP